MFEAEPEEKGDATMIVNDYELIRLRELERFSVNVKLVLKEYHKMIMVIPGCELKIEDCGFRFEDMDALCDEVAGVCNAELKKEN
jgi:hypothetical protein